MVYNMKIPRCSVCGKVSVNKLCLKCTNKTKYKLSVPVRCVICGKYSTSTDERWLKEGFKCMKCR